MLNIDQLLKNAAVKLMQVSPTANLDAELILCHVLGCTRVDLILKKYDIVSEELSSAYETLIEERLSGNPVSYIVGKQEFMGLDFEVNKHVLIPRPDTEILIEQLVGLVDSKVPINVLDIGTGSGAIPIALAHFLKHAKAWTIDISVEASEVAKNNAKRNHVDDRITFLLGDLYEPLNTIDEPLKFDVIVSNPPYIPSADIEDLQVEVATFEPRLALDGGSDGLDFYRRIVKDALIHLKVDGIIAFEIGYDQAQAVAKLLEERGFTKIKVVKDLAGKDRVVIGRL